MADSRIGAGDMQMNQKHLVVPENKEVNKQKQNKMMTHWWGIICGVCQRDTGVNWKHPQWLKLEQSEWQIKVTLGHNPKFPAPGDLPNPGMESPALQQTLYHLSHQGSLIHKYIYPWASRTWCINKWEKKPFSCAQEFRINYVDIPPYRSITPHTLYVHSNFLPKNTVWKDGREKE